MNSKVIIIIFLIILNMYGLTYADDINISIMDRVEFSEPENLGKPIVSTTLLNCVTGVEDGNPTLYTTVSGTPAKFNVFDLELGKTIRSFDMEFGNTAWVHTIDAQGNVYVAGYTNATLYKYCPVDKSFISIGRVAGEVAVTAFAVDENDNIYMGTYPNAKIIKYNPLKDEFTDYGKILPGESYMKTLFYYDGALYGGGSAASTSFVKVDLDTSAVEFISGPNISATISSYYSGRISGSRIIIYCGTVSSGSIYVVFDLEREEFLDIEIPNAQGLYASPELDGYAYFVANRTIYRYNLSEDTYRTTGISYGAGFRGGGFVKLNNNPNFPNLTYANVLYSGEISLIDFKTGASLKYSDTIEPVGTPLETVAAIGDYVYASGHMGPTATQYDPEKKEIVANFPMGQSTPIKEIEGKVYFACYPNVDLHVFDPSKPVQDKVNPKKLFDIDKDYGQSRPMDIVQAGNKIVVSTIADYGMLEGAIIIYNSITEETEVYKNIIKNQSVSGLAYKDGILYGSTTVFGGLGSIPTEEEAKIFKFDMNTREVILERVLKPLNETTPLKMAGGLKFGPDGLLWSVSDGLVFAMDPDNLEIVKEKNINGFNWASYSSRWAPYTLEFDKNGLLYCTPRNTAVVLDISTMEFKKILPDKYDRAVGKISLSENGYIYFSERDTIMRTAIFEVGEKIYIDSRINNVRLKFRDLEYNFIKDFGSIDGINIEAEVYNIVSKDTSISLIAVLYNADGILVSSDFKHDILTTDNPLNTFKLRIVMPEDICNNHYIKVLILESIGSLRPLTSTILYSK